MTVVKRVWRKMIAINMGVKMIYKYIRIHTEVKENDGSKG